MGLELADHVVENKARLDELEGVNGGVSDISAGLEKLSNIVTDLTVSVAKVRREHDRLAMKVEDMMKEVPEGHRLELVEVADEDTSQRNTGGTGTKKKMKSSGPSNTATARKLKSPEEKEKPSLQSS